MTTPVPPRSMPPPKLPPEVAARTRIRWLEREVERESDGRHLAMLEFELGALEEHRLLELDGAVKHYLAAYNHDPAFRPPLLALTRIFSERRSYKNVARILKSASRTAPSVAQGAAAALEHGAVLRDRLGNADEAIALWEETLKRNPEQRSIALMLEHHYRSAAQFQDAERITRIRAEQAKDPVLKACLLRECAETETRSGHADEALALMRAACTLPSDRLRSLETMARLAQLMRRPAEAADALEATASFYLDEPPAEAPDSSMAARPELPPGGPTHRKQQAAAALRQAALLRSGPLQDPEGALPLLTRAIELTPRDALLRHERMHLCQLVGDMQTLVTDAGELLQGASGSEAAALHFRMAEAAQLGEDPETARKQLALAIEADPDAAAAIAVLEDALLDEAHYGELCTELERRAAQREGEARSRLLWRAAELTFTVLQDSERGAALYAAAAECARDAVPLWRAMHGAAVLREQHGAAVEAARRMLELDLAADERSALQLDRYRRTQRNLQDPKAAARLLELALDDPSCGGWAPDCARITAALAGDLVLLARAHLRLAERAQEDAAHAAHMCAAARAMAHGDNSEQAMVTLQAALERAPSNSYAVALLEELLLARGDATQAVKLLREAALAQHNARKGELSLLHAGSAAEAAGQAELAAASYHDAIDRDPTALSPLWALRRLGEQQLQLETVLEAERGLARRDWGQDSGRLQLQLGELLDTADQGQEAVAHLAAAMHHPATMEGAALALALLGETAAGHDERDRALAYLTAAGGPLAPVFARERVGTLMHTDRTRARALLGDDTVQEQLVDWVSAARLAGADTPAERATLFAQMGDALGDADAATELRLHSIRARSLSGDADAAEDGLMLAVEMAESAPDALATAVALDETLTGGDDADARAEALTRRLVHARPDMAPSLRAAQSRALMAAERALDAAAAARRSIQQNDDDLVAWDLLRVAARQMRQWPSVVEAGDRLAKNCKGSLRSMLLEEAAEILVVELDRCDEAESRLAEALQADPDRRAPFDRLHDLLLRRHDYAGTVALLDRRLDRTAEADERCDLLYEKALLLRGMEQRETALSSLEELLTIAPEHQSGLRLASEIHASLEQWRRCADMLSRLAEAAPTTEERIEVRTRASDILDDQLSDAAGSHGQLAALAREGVAGPEMLERMGVLAQRAGLHEEAAQAYEQGAREEPSAEGRARLLRAAGQVYEGPLDDPERAVTAFRQALEATPVDLEACSRLRKLVSDDSQRRSILDAFAGAVQQELSRDPLNPDLLRMLRQVGEWQERRDLKKVALGALVALGYSQEEEAQAYGMLTDSTRRTLNPLEGDALKQLSGRRLTGPTAQAGVLVSQALNRAEPSTPSSQGADRKHRLGRWSDNAVREAVAEVVRVFGGKVAEFYVGCSEADTLMTTSPLSKGQVWVAGSGALAPLSSAHLFRAGRAAFRHQLDLSDLAARPLSEARAAMQACALAVEQPLPNAPDDEEMRARASLLGKSLPKAERRKLAAALDQIRSAAEVEAYLHAVQLADASSGLLLCDDLAVALSEILGPGYDLDRVQQSPLGLQLVRFWTSSKWIALRDALRGTP